MLSLSVLNILKNGVYVNNLLFLYKDLNFLKILNIYFGLYKYFLFIIFKKIEFQINGNSFLTKLRFNANFLNTTKNLSYYRLFNLELMKIVPPFKQVKRLYDLNILRKYLIKDHQGKSHLIGKPVNGQSTKSNAKTSKEINVFLRHYVKSKKLLDNSNWS